MRPFRDYSSFLLSHFEGKVQKLSVNAGFGCPNRDGTVSRGGCSYCNNAGFTPSYCSAGDSISLQLEAGKRFFSRKYPEMHYLAYFQSYTNTYAPLDVLRSRYEEALGVDGVAGLIIGTRPDCIDGPLLDILAELSERTFIMLEYGVETTDDDLLKSLNRGHTFQQAARAIRKTAECCIPVTAHVILGLPGQTREQMVKEAAVLSDLPVDILKLHQLQIVRGSAMAEDYEKNPADYGMLFATPESYAEVVMDFLQHLRPDIVLERFTAQCPPDLLIAPRWGMKNYEFVHLICREMANRNIWQGKKWSDNQAVEPH